jgi:putative aldouronate transport system permease protein
LKDSLVRSNKENKHILGRLNFNTADIKKQFLQSKYLLILFLPGLLYYIIFRYLPMYGVIIAFKDFNAVKGILGSEWVGMKHFISFFNNPNAWRLIRNTIALSGYGLLWGFPAPIILALLLNEIKNSSAKRIFQTVSYMPHFISTVIVVGMVINFLSPTDGIINKFIVAFGGEPIFFMKEPGWFRTVYIASGIWKEVGWGAIIYIAALTGINPEIYEAAIVDGANRWKQLIHVTLPGIAPTVTIMLILRIGSLMDVGFEKVMLLYNSLLYEKADIISTYVYRRGIEGANFSFATAIGLMDSLIGLVLIVSANKISKKISEESLW